jgi:outer membrane protein
MNRSLLRRRTGCWLMAACCAAPAATAQTPLPSAESGNSGLALEDVLRVTLHDNANIRVAARAVDVDRGSLVAAGDPFDVKVVTAINQNRFNIAQPNASASHYAWIDTSQTQYSVGFDKQLRRGIVVSPELAVSRTALPGLPLEPTSQATARLSVLVPLARDRGGLATIAPERAAERTFESSTFQAQHVTAQSVLAAVTAYWDYQAALTRLEVLTSSVERARRLFEDTRRLIAGDERPPSDLTQVQGNLAAKQVTRTLAEQAVLDARVRLGLVMGVSPAETAALGQATTPLPEVDAASAIAVETPALVEQALDKRADLRAVGKSVESARIRVVAARDSLNPRVDLVSSIGYAGIQVGGSLGSLFSPVYSNVPGADLSISFHYQWATTNVGARGRLLQSESGLEQARIAQDDLQRQIRTAVYQASESIARNASAMAEAHEAVTLYEATVRSEERKFQVGVSTLFDTIQAADALTSVRSSEITAQHDYAVALATLRFQTGSLIATNQQGPMVDVDRLLKLR